MMRSNAAPRFIALALLFGAVIFVQVLYDATKIAVPAGERTSLSPQIVRMLDMGFHSTVGSFLWVSTMPEVLDMFHRNMAYISDVSYLNAVDPKLGYPYAFSILILPAIPPYTGYTTGAADAITVGKRGLANADPDWRIPYYLATHYYLEYKDMKNAALYFDVAARTPGIPFYAQRFAENFGNEEKDRDRTIELWKTIRDTTNDPDTRDRAQAYVDHLEIFNYLDAAVGEYKKQFGVFPAVPEALVEKHIIPAIPEDPFGGVFIIDAKGVVSLDLNAVPVHKN